MGTTFVCQLQPKIGMDMRLAKNNKVFCGNQFAIWNLYAIYVDAGIGNIYSKRVHIYAFM